MASTRRRPRGEATRVRIIEAATRLFCRDGYLATTVGQIAREAGVAVQTLYLAYGSKVAILSAAHDAAVVGDAEAVPMLERPWVRQLSEATDAAAALSQMLENLWESTARVAPVYAVVQNAAADPFVAELLTRLREMRIETCRGLADRLLAAPGADPGADPQRLADVVYAVVGFESYQLFVTERGWSPAAWQQWTHGVLEPELLGSPS